MDPASDLGLIISCPTRLLSVLWLRKIFNPHLAEVLECGVQCEGVTDMAWDDHRVPSRQQAAGIVLALRVLDMSVSLIALLRYK